VLRIPLHMTTPASASPRTCVKTTRACPALSGRRGSRQSRGRTAALQRN